MSELTIRILELKKQLELALAQTHDLEALEQLRISFIGRTGSITELMGYLKNLSIEEKRVAGPQLNELKEWAQNALLSAQDHIKQEIMQREEQAQKYFDVTAYYRPDYQGSLHVFTHIIRQIEDIFISMGYEVVDGPEVETGHYNFEALNIPADHPARDMHDTFWLSTPDLLMRTHTSNVQPRTMESRKPPFAIFTPGRCFRNEATDASHDFMFMQGEVFFVDKNVSVANLFATARTFLQALFEKEDIKIRMRPGYFPFVEPGIEIDASCPFCNNGCSTCKHSGWIELLGSGLIHPNVLRACNINPDEYSGFALGFGLTRIAMLKYGISDVRLFNSTKLSFLEQFK